MARLTWASGAWCPTYKDEVVKSVYSIFDNEPINIPYTHPDMENWSKRHNYTIPDEFLPLAARKLGA